MENPEQAEFLKDRVFLKEQGGDIRDICYAVMWDLGKMVFLSLLCYVLCCIISSLSLFKKYK